ncbi:hypothetical protein ACHAQH_005977 [Verticillium albo-atrum]
MQEQESPPSAIPIEGAQKLAGFRILGAALAGHTAAATAVREIFSTVLPKKPGRDELNGLHARLTYRETGTIARQHPRNRLELAPIMLNVIVKACEDNGTRLEDFLTPDAIEAMFRRKLCDAYDEADRTAQGLGSPEDTARLRGLVHALVKSSVCLGDRPRWTANRAENVLNVWASSTHGTI